MKHVFVLNESTLVRLLVFTLLRRDVYLSYVLPAIRQLRGPLAWLANRLIASGRLKPARMISPDLPWLEGYPGNGHYNDHHHRIEKRLGSELGLKPGRGLSEEYALAFRKAATDTYGDHMALTLLVEWLSNNMAPGSWALHGASRMFDWFESAIWGALPTYERRPAWQPDVLFRALNHLIIGLGGFVWVLARIRLKVTVREFGLMTDRVSHWDIYRIAKLAPVVGSVAVLERSESMRRKDVAGLGGHARIVREDARLLPGQGWLLLRRMARELIALWRHDRGVHPSLAAAHATLVVKRAMYDGFFTAFKPRYFWGMDEYSLDHTVRHLALRKVGGRAVGAVHGLPLNTYAYPWREIDFDIYYIFSSRMYDFYKDVWPASMSVRTAGNYKMPSEHFAQVRAGIKRPPDIAFCAMASYRLPEFLDYVKDIARHFPERKVYIKMKPGRLSDDMERFRTGTADVPANIVVTQEDTYALMLSRVTYMLTSGSTVSGEALGYGLVSFVFREPHLSHPFYDNFPDMTVNDATDVIARIEAIEAGRERYDFERMRGLINFDSDFYETIAEDFRRDFAPLDTANQ